MPKDLSAKEKNSIESCSITRQAPIFSIGSYLSLLVLFFLWNGAYKSGMVQNKPLLVHQDGFSGKAATANTLDSGTSSWIIGDAFAYFQASGFSTCYADDFDSSTGFAGDDGTNSWSNNWQELGESNGTGSGMVQVVSNSNCASGECLRIGTVEGTMSGNGVSRTADLGSATSATLSYSFKRNQIGCGSCAGATLSAEVSGDGGSTWNTLASYTMNTSDPSQTVESFDITAYAAVNTQIRFIGNGFIGSDGDYIYIDNIQISCIIGSVPPTANDDTDNTSDNTPVTTDVLANDSDANGNIDATSVTIVTAPTNGNVTVDAVTGAITYTPDTLFAGTDQYTYQVCDTDPTCDQGTVTITIADRTHIIGHVFEDQNVNGVFDSGDNGQIGVTVILYEDNNQDGQVDAGDTQLSTQSTDANGFFDFVPSLGASPQTITSRVASINDDAEEALATGSIDLTSSDLELISDGGTDQLVGIRFTNISVPQGATITNAYIEFEVDELDSGTTNLTFKGQDSDNASTFSSTAFDISNTTNRPRTSALVPWDGVAAWSTESEKKQTPDLSAIIQEIVDRGGWSSGNSVVIFVEGSGERTAEAFEGEPANAPLLSITYTTASYPYHYVLKIDTTTLPATALMTTDTIETAVINVQYQDDSNNDFGFSLNTPPTANGDTDSTPEDLSVITNVTLNDTDSDGTIDPATVTISSAPSNGNTSVNTTTGEVTYTPDLNYNGSDQYIYRVCDDDGACDTAVVVINITPQNDDPNPTDNAFTVAYNTVNQPLDVLNAGVPDYDIDGDTITLSGVGTDASNGATAQGGTVSINNNGTAMDPTDDFVEYTPATDFVGVDTFLYLLTDGNTGSANATVTLTVLSTKEIDCINGFDDDGDGYLDTADPDCTPVTPVNILRKGAN